MLIVSSFSVILLILKVKKGKLPIHVILFSSSTFFHLQLRTNRYTLFFTLGLFLLFGRPAGYEHQSKKFRTPLIITIFSQAYLPKTFLLYVEV